MAEENILKTNEVTEGRETLPIKVNAIVAPERECARYIVPHNKEVILFFILVFLILFCD